MRKICLLVIAGWFMAARPIVAATPFSLSTHGVGVLSLDGKILGFFRLSYIPQDIDTIPDKDRVVVATTGPVFILNGKGRVVSSRPWVRVSDVDVLERDGSRFLLTWMERRRVSFMTAVGAEREATHVTLEGPRDADLLPEGNLLIADTLGNRVLEVDREDRVVWEFSRGLLHPWDAERLPDGGTLIADFDNHRVLKVSVTGEILREYRDFDHPRRITVTDTGDLYIADSDRQRVVVIHPDDSRDTFAGELNRVIAVAPLPGPKVSGPGTETGGGWLVAVEAWFRVHPAPLAVAVPQKRPPFPVFRFVLLCSAALGVCGSALRLPAIAALWARRIATLLMLGLSLSCQWQLAAGRSPDHFWIYPLSLTVLALATGPSFRELQKRSQLRDRLRARLSAAVGTPSSERLGWWWVWGACVLVAGAACFGLRYRNVSYIKIVAVWIPAFLFSLSPVWKAIAHSIRARVRYAPALPGSVYEFFGLRFFLPIRNISGRTDKVPVGEASCLCEVQSDTLVARCNTALLCILLLSVPLLCIRLEDIPTSVHGDSAEVAFQGIELRKSEPLHFFRLGWYDIPALFFLYPAAVMRWCGENVWGMRLSDVFMGFLSLPFLYGSLRRLYDCRVAVVGTALLAGCAYFIHFSRLGVGYNQTTFWTLVVFYLFLRCLQTGSLTWYTLCGAAIGLSFYTYQASRILGVLVAASWVLVGLRTRGLFRRDAGKFLLMCAVAWLVLSPLMAVYALYPHTFNSRARDVSIFGKFGRDWIRKQRGPSSSWKEIAWQQAKRGLLAPIAYSDGSPYLNNRGYEGILEPGAALFFSCGCLLAVATLAAPTSFLPAVWLFPLMILGGAMTNNAPSYQRYVGMVPVMIMFAAPVLWSVGESIAGKSAMRTALVAVMVAWICLSGVDRYFYGMMQLKQPVDEWTRIARYVAQRGPNSYTYMFGAPYVFFGYGTIRFLAQGCEGEDVTNPDAFLSRRITRRGPVSFVFVFDREKYLPRVRALYPGGVEIRHRDAAGQFAFATYHTAL